MWRLRSYHLWNEEAKICQGFGSEHPEAASEELNQVSAKHLKSSFFIVLTYAGKPSMLRCQTRFPGAYGAKYRAGQVFLAGHDAIRAMARRRPRSPRFAHSSGLRRTPQ